MTETTLRLLMSDGMLSATFVPALMPDQYKGIVSSLMLYSTKDELRKWIERAAKTWDISVTIDLNPD